MKIKYKLLSMVCIIMLFSKLWFLSIPLSLMILKPKMTRLQIINLIPVFLIRLMQLFIAKKDHLALRDILICYDCSEEGTQLVDALSLFKNAISERKQAYYLCHKDHPQYSKLKEKYKNRIIGFRNINLLVWKLIFILPFTRATVESFGGLATSKFTGSFLRKNKKIDFIFIQHGITFFKSQYLKKWNYSKNKYDKILISNEYEEKIFSDYGFEDGDFIKVGLPRWDHLQKVRKKKEKSIFVYFTHRQCFLNLGEDYKETKYYKNLIRFLTNKKLQEILREHNIKLKIALHHVFHQDNITFCDIYNISKNIEIIGESEIAKVKKEASMLITDYSSMCFDFFFQEKPVIFYQLDYLCPLLRCYDMHNEREFQRKKHLLFNNCITQEELCRLTTKCIKNNFELSKSQKEKASRFFYEKNNIRQKILCEIFKK